MSCHARQHTHLPAFMQGLGLQGPFLSEVVAVHSPHDLAHACAAKPCSMLRNMPLAARSARSGCKGFFSEGGDVIQFHIEGSLTIPTTGI